MSNKVSIHEGKRFNSYKEFEDALHLYERDNNCIFVTSSSCSIENENKKLLASGSNQLYNLNLKHKNVKLTCKFGGEQRIGKGSGLRQFQTTFKIGCPAVIHLIARRDHLFIKQMVKTHENHNCTPEEVNIIPEARRVHDEDLPMVQTLLDGKVKPGRIRILLRGTQSGRVTSRDIANLRAKRKRESEGGRSKEQLLCDTLCGLHDQDPEAYIHVQKDLDENLEVLFIQTSRMRKNVQEYGCVLLFDHTYKICEESMPVSVLQVVDGNGNGRSGGFAFIANEEMVTIATVLQAFRQSIGEVATSNIRTVVIDKDYSEAGAIKTVLPNAETQLCDFHVTKTLKSRTLKKDERVKAMVMEMRYCETDQRFQHLALEIKKLASKNFFDYYEKNWIKCPLAWSYRDKKKSPHFGNTTTGRLEKLNATFKLVLNSKSALYESVQAITELVKNKEDDVMYAEIGASVKHCYMTKNTDPIVTQLLNEVTLYAAKKILGYKEEAVKGVPHRTDTTTTSCGCAIYTHTFLPCPHILQMRIETDLCWYDPDTILSMYKKSPAISTPTVSVGSPRVGVSIAPAKIVPKTSAQKYNATLAQGKKVASLLSECGQTQYRRRFQVLVDLWNIWADGKEATVVTMIADKPINGAEIEITEQSVLDQEEDISVQNTPLQETPLQDAQLQNLAVQNTPFQNKPLQETPIQNSAVQHTPLRNTPKGVEDIPDCFCNKPCIRLRARPDSRIRGRYFWKCNQVKIVGEDKIALCGFFRLAKSQPVSPQPVSPQPVSPQPVSPQPVSSPPVSPQPVSPQPVSPEHVSPQPVSSQPVSSQPVSPEPESPQEMLSLLVEMIEKDLLESGTEQDLDSEKRNGLVNEEEPQNNALREAFLNISLPKAVKHRGRPKNLGKTVHKWTTSRKARPLVSTEDSHSAKTQACQDRASHIEDSAVVKTRPNQWTVKSQSNKSKVYTVTKLAYLCNCLSACSKCFNCTCPDFSYKRHIRACKHIFKLAELLNRAGNSNFIDSSSLEDGMSCNSMELQSDVIFPIDRSNVTIRKKRGVSWDAVDVKPKLVKTSGITEIVTISDSDSDSEDKNMNIAVKTAMPQMPSGGEDCPICLVSGPPQSGGHKCAHCLKLVHAFGCSAPNPGGVEGHGGSDRLCWPCFHKVTGSCSKGDGQDFLPQVPRETFPETVCVVCQLPEVGNNQCISCMQPVHSEECSFKKGEGLTCQKCFCLLCKCTFRNFHVCQCHICSQPASLEDGIICYRCEKITHPHACSKKIRAKEKNNDLRYICQNCLYALTVGVSVQAKTQITGNEMLTDEHMVRASLMLAAQFGTKFDGFCAPIGVSYGNRLENIDYYPHRRNTDIPWVQILNTGQDHWVTAIFQKGSPVKIMDSMRSKPITGHTQIQVAMIMHSKDRITIGRPPCKQQENGVDCGLFAIAHATEFCFSSEIQYVDFEPAQLRTHWLRCLEQGSLTQFPRLSKRPKKVKEQEEFEILSTYCTCRLPDNYSNVIRCDGCSLWYHHKCAGLQESDAEIENDEDWYCRTCLEQMIT